MMLPLPGPWVQSLVGELRSYRPCSVTKKREKENELELGDAVGHKRMKKIRSDNYLDIDGGKRYGGN